MENNIQKVKIPAPNIGTSMVSSPDGTIEMEGKKYKMINQPHVGEITAPKISMTPVRDMVEIKRQENPYTIYKIKGKKYNIKNFQTATAAGIIACGIASIIKLIKK